ncbi:MAG: DUF72 domain-containing protein, partial [bacterium]|nr:DUF72 domain-containing protein [bacterium]
SYADWEGIVYPEARDKKFDALGYLVQYFNTIEVNSSFYRPPTEKVAKSWAQRVSHNPDFLFTYKLWQRFTHERKSYPSADDERLVKLGLDVLKAENKLGALLVQFPWSFRRNEQNLSWLQKILHQFQDYSPVVEVRHESWNNEQFYRFLTDHQGGFANIDQPVIGKSLPLLRQVTTEVSYLRLHGRNYDNWFASDATAASRYDYLYNEDELNSIKHKIEDLMENSSKTFIIFNNHYRGQAAANALQMLFLLSGQKPMAPENLPVYYPQLKAIVNFKAQQNSQSDLF